MVLDPSNDQEYFKGSIRRTILVLDPGNDQEYFKGVIRINDRAHTQVQRNSILDLVRPRNDRSHIPIRINVRIHISIDST